ncbi:29721_t:CDS:1, partial [Racocetra persica]
SNDLGPIIMTAINYINSKKWDITESDCFFQYHTNLPAILILQK